MTVMTETTNIIPTIGAYRALPENTAAHAAKPPRESEPVSPINAEAGKALNSKKPQIAAASTKQRRASGFFAPFSDEFALCNAIITPNERKYAALAPLAKPSSPSVRLTALTSATKTNAAKGIIHARKFTEFFVKGIRQNVSPAR